MNEEIFMEKLFDLINESADFPICDIETNTAERSMVISLIGGEKFKLLCENYSH